MGEERERELKTMDKNEKLRIVENWYESERM